MDPKTALETFKKVMSIAEKFKDIDMKEALLELKEQLLEIKEENIQLKEKLAQKANFNMVLEQNMYWNQIDNDSKEGPYCSTCWDNHKKDVRLHKVEDSFYCSVCKEYVSKEHRNYSNYPIRTVKKYNPFEGI